MDGNNKRVLELEFTTIEELREKLQRFDRLFSEKEQGENGVPTAWELEQIWGNLLSETKDSYAEHVSERLSNANEKPLIKRKKAIPSIVLMYRWCRFLFDCSLTFKNH